MIIRDYCSQRGLKSKSDQSRVVPVPADSLSHDLLALLLLRRTMVEVLPPHPYWSIYYVVGASRSIYLVKISCQPGW